MGYRLGIDVGTTFTAAAVRRGDSVDMVGLGNRALQMPSVVHVAEDGAVVVGEAAENRGSGDAVGVVREFKRRLGDPVPILVRGRPYSAELLTARLLRAVVDTTTEREGGPPDAVAVTHPANWGPWKLDLFGQALTLADLPEATLCPEPVAAAITYSHRSRVADGDVIAVYDLGGGTFDTAVLRHENGAFQVMGHPEGIEHLGGVDLDEAVFRHVLTAMDRPVTDLDPDDPDVVLGLARLRRDCVLAKEQLSSDTQATVTAALPGGLETIRLGRSELEELVRPAIEETVGAVRRVLRSADTAPEQLATILLVGGSSRIPVVSEVLVGAFGRPLAVDTHPKHDVALGAAWSGAATTTVVPHPPLPTAPPPEPAPEPPRSRRVVPAPLRSKVVRGAAASPPAVPVRLTKAPTPPDASVPVDDVRRVSPAPAARPPASPPDSPPDSPPAPPSGPPLFGPPPEPVPAPEPAAFGAPPTIAADGPAPPSSIDPAPPARRRRRGWWVVLAASAVVLVVAAALLATGTLGGGDHRDDATRTGGATTSAAASPSPTRTLRPARPMSAEPLAPDVVLVASPETPGDPATRTLLRAVALDGLHAFPTILTLSGPGSAALSHDRRTIAYVLKSPPATPGAVPNSQLYLVSADGDARSARTFTLAGGAPCNAGAAPSFGRDDTTLAITCIAAGATAQNTCQLTGLLVSSVFLVDLRDRNPVRLADDVTGPVAFSPDGNAVAFSQVGADGHCHIAEVGTDAPHTTTSITAGADDFQPAFSPDGNSLLFARINGSNADIWSRSLATGSEVPLADTADNEYQPAYAGTDPLQIVYSRTPVTSTSTDQSGLWIMNIDGSGQHLLAQ